MAAGGDYKQDPFYFPGVFPQNDRRSDTDGVSRLQHCLVLMMHSLDSDFRLSEEKTVCPVHLNDIDVPPTLVSFAVDVARDKDIITPELKKAGNKLVWIKIPKDEYDLPDYEKLMDQYGKFSEDVQSR